MNSALYPHRTWGKFIKRWISHYPFPIINHHSPSVSPIYHKNLSVAIIKPHLPQTSINCHHLAPYQPWLSILSHPNICRTITTGHSGVGPRPVLQGFVALGLFPGPPEVHHVHVVVRVDHRGVHGATAAVLTRREPFSAPRGQGGTSKHGPCNSESIIS